MPVKTFLISSDVSISTLEDLVRQSLQTDGLVLIKERVVPKENAELEKQIIAISLLLGRTLARSAAYVTLQKENDSQYLAKHTESIYASKGITPYFILGCVLSAEEGGQTRVFSARHAATIVRNEYSDIALVEIEYSSAAYQGETAVYPLCVGDALRFRGKTPQNQILNLPVGYSEESFYRTVESVLERTVILNHTWERGDILMVNNNITLHDRTPYKGMRIMVRMRFDDPLNVSVRY